jgi:hypothetical protein
VRSQGHRVRRGCSGNVFEDPAKAIVAGGKPVGFSGDTEARRHRQASAAHFTEIAGLSADDGQHACVNLIEREYRLHMSLLASLNLRRRKRREVLT